MGIIDTIKLGIRSNPFNNAQEKMRNELINFECCPDIKVQRRKVEYNISRDDIDKLYKYIPSCRYVEGQIESFLFSNGLTCGVGLDDKGKLNPFLFRVNKSGNNNLGELKSAVRDSLTYGCSGLRYYDGDIYFYPSDKFEVVDYIEDGVVKTYGYVIKKDNTKVTLRTKLIKTESDLKSFLEQVSSENSNYMLLSIDEFCLIRNDFSKRKGVSPFEKDRLRTKLLIDLYEELSYDLTNGSPGRIAVNLKDGWTTNGKELGASSILSSSLQSAEARREKLENEIRRISNQIKNSDKNDVVVMSNMFDKNITHLPTLMKSTELISWIEDEVAKVAEMYEVPPNLIGAGKMSGNVSMSKIIDTIMLNYIVPKREHYAMQFSKFISKIVGVDKIYFDRYELEQSEDLNTTRVKVSQGILNLTNSANLLGKVYETTQQDVSGEIEKISTCINTLSDMLENSLRDESNDIKDIKQRK